MTQRVAVAGGKLATTNLGIVLTVLALLGVLFLLQENGFALSAQAAHQLHELTHDARHALGVPCH